MHFVSFEAVPSVDGICEVGDVLAPGESCTYPGTDTAFSVNSNGNGQFLFFSSGSRLNIRDTQINNVSYTLVAEKLDSGSWEIKALGATAAPPPTTNNAPVFTDGASTTRTVAENTAAGMNIGTSVSATDADNDTLTYSLGGDPDAAAFSIVSTSGQLQTKAALDAATKSTYSVTITVSDGTLTDTIPVTISVTGTSVEPPSVADGICRVGDMLAPGESCTYPGTDTEFSVNSNGNGQFLFFSSGSRLNIRDTQINNVSYTLVAEKLDSGSWEIKALGATAAPAPTTNHAPVFTEGVSTTRSVTKNTAAGQHIGSAVAATDVDSGDTLTYTLGGTDAAAFDIDRATGQLKTKATLDAETKSTYTVTVTVSDGTLTDTITVTINVTQTSIEPPPVADGICRVGDMLAPGESRTYPGTDTEFSVNSSGNGQFLFFSSGSRLNIRDTQINNVSYTLVAEKLDSGSWEIKELGTTAAPPPTTNNAPVFTEGASTTRTVTENTAAGVNIGSAVSATDADNDTLTYRLGGTHAASFRLDSTTGQLRTSSSLNANIQSTCSVTVSVSDGKGGTDSITVTINVTGGDTAPVADGICRIGDMLVPGESCTYPGTDTAFSVSSTGNGQFLFFSSSSRLNIRDTQINNISYTLVAEKLNSGSWEIKELGALPVPPPITNHAPVFTEGVSATRSVTENTATGVNIGTPMAATDADTGDTLTYTLGGTDADSFRIVSTSGQLQTNAALNYESKSSYSVSVSVSDNNGGSDSIPVTITVTNVNETPSFATNTATRVIAENTASGRNIGTAIAATDVDANTTLIYTLGGADASSFSIVSTSGQLQTSAALNFELKPSYSVSVTASDGSLSDTISVTISVTNVNEAPNFTEGSSVIRSVAENTASGRNIGTAIAATDVDANTTLSYTLGGTDASSFRIVSTSGQLQTSAALDYESKPSYSVSVSVSDGSGGRDSIAVTINVTDVDETPANSAPTFTEGTSTTRSVAENTRSGTNIGSAVAATDADTGDTLTCTLGGADASSFSIVSTSGQLRTRAALNYESKSSYSVSVSVSDGNGGSDSIAVTINVTNVNEAPNFTAGSSTTRSIAENTASGRNIGTAIAATDVDANTTLTYTLSGADASSFSVVSTSGQLRTRAALNYESKSSYSVTVSVSDGNGGSDSIAVTINVTNVNEAPSFTAGSTATRSIAENTAANTDIGAAVAATDVDANTTLVYTLGGTDADSFSIVSTSGQLQTSAALDYETQSSYSVTVTAADGNGGSDSITVTINVTDVSEFTPVNERTQQVRDAIVAAVPNVNNAADVTATHLAAITSLVIDYRRITTLKVGDFDGFTSLTNLVLKHNSISDISALKNLTSLKWLFLGFNPISDISALENLTSLKWLYLHNNSISDISTLENLTSLTQLFLSYNSISDISALEKLTALTWVDLSRNSISDISALGKLTALTDLKMDWNSISDISALGKLTALTKLNLHWNPISDISALENLTSLTRLILSNNWISDISALEDLTALTELALNNNSISDVSALEDLTALTELGLSGNQISDYGPLRRLKAAIAVIEDHPGLTLDITIPAVADNNAPVFSDGDSTTRSVAENTDSGTNIGSVVAATDKNTGDTLTYHLGGTDADSFRIVKSSGQLQTKAELDAETKSTYTVKVAVSDGKGGTDSITVTINVTEAAGAAPSLETSPVIPDNTVLLTNFPNPFNPETWIPYQLAEPSEVTLTIYDIQGRVVRRLALGHQPAGFYQSRSKAVHWDGRNQLGEKVATGVYFYTLKAGDFSATRKMLIRK